MDSNCPKPIETPAVADRRAALHVHREAGITGNFRVRYKLSWPPERSSLETEARIEVADGYGNKVSSYLIWRPHRETDGPV